MRRLILLALLLGGCATEPAFVMTADPPPDLSIAIWCDGCRETAPCPEHQRLWNEALRTWR